VSQTWDEGVGGTLFGQVYNKRKIKDRLNGKVTHVGLGFLFSKVKLDEMR
jgi:hypothetical protein